MIIALLLSLLFIVVTSAFLFFFLYIFYPSLEQQNFSTKDLLIMPWPRGWPDTAKKPLFLFNSPADCHVVHLISSGKEGRQDLCAGFEKCIDICPRLNLAERHLIGSPSRACPFEHEMGVEHALHYRIFGKKLSAIQKKLTNKRRGPS
jgi:hypothetical protein